MPCAVHFSLAVLEKKYFYVINIVALFSHFLLLEEDTILHLNKIESPSFKQNWTSFTRECFVQSLKLIQWFYRKFKKVVNIFFTVYLSPTWLGLRPIFVQNWIQITKGSFVPNLVQIGSWRDENVKSSDRRTDIKQVIRVAYKGSQLRWAKNFIQK